MKKETIEEVAANLADPNLCKTDNWIAGAKWQAERMYSEEDLKSAFFNGGGMKDIEEFNYWLEQFKKK